MPISLEPKQTNKTKIIRKQSLVNQSTNHPFVVVTQKLDQLPDHIDDITREQIVLLTEPLIGWGTPDEMMALAKTASRSLFCEFEPNERVQLINKLVMNINQWLCIRLPIVGTKLNRN